MAKKERLRRKRKAERLKNSQQLPIEESIKDNKTEQIKEQIMAEKSDVIETEDIPFEDFNPMNEPVINKSYTKRIIEANIGAIPDNYIDEDIPEPTYDRPEMEEEEIDIGEPAKPTPKESESTSSSSSSSQSKSEPFGGKSSFAEESTTSVNPPLEDLSDKEKRKAAKKTADAILVSYQKFFPMPFKKIASFNMAKLNKLDMKGDIRLKMQIQEDGTTVGSYCLGVNQQVEETIVVTDEMVEELRQPLVDVLMEQDMALTPTQRLMVAGGSQFIQLLVPTMQIALSNKDAIKTFKQFKADDDASGTTTTTQSVPSDPKEKQSETTVEDIQTEKPTNEDSNIDDAVILDEENYEEPSLGIDDYINGGDEEEFDNTNVTIEEELITD